MVTLTFTPIFSGSAHQRSETIHADRFILEGGKLVATGRTDPLATFDDGYWRQGENRFLVVRSDSVCEAAFESDWYLFPLGMLNGFVLTAGVLRQGTQVVAFLNEHTSHWTPPVSRMTWPRIVLTGSCGSSAGPDVLRPERDYLA